MEKRTYTIKSTEIAVFESGKKDAPVTLIWAHGWGQSHKAFHKLIQSFEKTAFNVAVDFPGFGESPMPPDAWSVEDYAEACVEILQQYEGAKIWCGHSFGCRVGIRLAAKYPNSVNGLFLISAAGLKRKRPLHKQIYLNARVMLFKTLKKLAPENYHEKLYALFGSRDFKSAGPMRAIFTKTVNDDLAEAAGHVSCPVHLIYGENDDETPPAFGARFQSLMPNASLTVLPGQDHYTVLAEARHQTAAKLMAFIEEFNKSH